ncbi:hypothetical protein THAOC_01245, partial [Thalassiosira oceanica]
GPPLLPAPRDGMPPRAEPAPRDKTAVPTDGGRVLRAPRRAAGDGRRGPGDRRDGAEARGGREGDDAPP